MHGGTLLDVFQQGAHPQHGDREPPDRRCARGIGGAEDHHPFLVPGLLDQGDRGRGGSQGRPRRGIERRPPDRLRPDFVADCGFVRRLRHHVQHGIIHLPSCGRHAPSRRVPFPAFEAGQTAGHRRAFKARSLGPGHHRHPLPGLDRRIRSQRLGIAAELLGRHRFRVLAKFRQTLQFELVEVAQHLGYSLGFAVRQLGERAAPAVRFVSARRARGKDRQQQACGNDPTRLDVPQPGWPVGRTAAARQQRRRGERGRGQQQRQQHGQEGRSCQFPVPGTRVDVHPEHRQHGVRPGIRNRDVGPHPDASAIRCRTIDDRLVGREHAEHRGRWSRVAWLRPASATGVRRSAVRDHKHGRVLAAAQQVQALNLIAGLPHQDESGPEPLVRGRSFVAVGATQRRDANEIQPLRNAATLRQQVRAHLAVGPPHSPPRAPCSGRENRQNQNGGPAVGGHRRW